MVHILAVDLAKNVFQLHWIDRKGRSILMRRVRRDQLLKVLGELSRKQLASKLPRAHSFWRRHFEKLGHTVKIMAPQYVKPFVRREKNDTNDAEAICTAVQQRNMRFVSKKTLGQQDIQALHRARQRLVNRRTALISQMRGLLLDRGIAIAISSTRARRLTPKILAAPSDELTALMQEVVSSLYAFMLQIDERIKAFDRKIDAIFKTSDVCQKIAKIRGIGPKTATAMIAARRRLRLQERPPSGTMFRTCTTPAVEWRSQSDDGYQKAWQSALENTSLSWCARSCPHGSEKNRLKKYVGQRASPAARL
jgi:transposase